jgi:hypothetical protein
VLAPAAGRDAAPARVGPDLDRVPLADAVLELDAEAHEHARLAGEARHAAADADLVRVVQRVADVDGRPRLRRHDFGRRARGCRRRGQQRGEGGDQDCAGHLHA